MQSIQDDDHQKPFKVYMPHKIKLVSNLIKVCAINSLQLSFV